MQDKGPRGMKPVEVPALSILFVESAGGMKGAARAFGDLESRLGSTLGRRLFWVFFRGTYRACAERKEGDDLASLGLAEGVVPDERYARRRLRVGGHFYGLGMEPIREEFPLAAERTEVDYFMLQGETILMLPMPRKQ